MAGAGACVLVSACVGNPFRDAQVDPNSPVAAEVARVARSGGAYPTFASIPPIPKDLRPVRQYGRDAKQVEASRAELEQATAPDTWSLTDPDAFAAKARAQAGAEPAPQASDAAGFAETQRKRATPPPPPPN
ncbi:MAG TPA: hypothetical protein VHV27_09800 [Phenylobacterium sp.]|nr:hypothetical protein [Phenylobacterium sp.]